MNLSIRKIVQGVASLFFSHRGHREKKKCEGEKREVRNKKTAAGNRIYRIIRAAFSYLNARIMPKISLNRVQVLFG